VPPNIAPRLLTAAAKAPNFEEAMSEMKVLAGKFEERALEAAALESLRNQDTQTCGKFLAMSSLLSIPKSQRTFETFAKASCADLAMLRALVVEAEAPLSKVFAKSVLEACISMKEVDLAAEVFEKVAACDAQSLRHIVEKGSSEGSSRQQPAPCKAPRSATQRQNLRQQFAPAESMEIFLLLSKPSTSSLFKAPCCTTASSRLVWSVPT